MSLWDLQSKRRVFDNILANGSNFLFAPNGDSFVTNAWVNNSWQQAIQEWNLSSQSQENFEGVLTDLNGDVSKPPLFSPSGDLLAMGGTEDWRRFSFLLVKPHIRFWDSNSRKFLFDITHAGLNDYKFSPDGKIFASAGEKTIYFWDLKTQKNFRQFDSPKNIASIAFSPDGALIAAAAADGVYIWDTNSGKLISEFNNLKDMPQKFEAYAIRQVVFSPQGNILAAIGYDKDGHKTLLVWDLSKNELMYRITGDQDSNAGSNNAGRAGLLFSPGGSFIITSGLKRAGYGEYVQFWDTTSGQLIKTLGYTIGFDPYSPYENRFGFSPDGRLFAIADGTVHILYITASSDNGKEDVLLPTLTPLPTSIPEPTLTPTITPTPAPTVAIESIFPNLSVVKTDSFDDPNSPEWQLDPGAAKIKDGNLEITGMNWKGVSRALREGDGIIVNFKFTQDAWFVINLAPEMGQHGVVLFGGKLADVMTKVGSNETHKPLSGNLVLIPGNWYSMLMTIGKKGETLIRIWDPADPLKTIENTDSLGSDWVGTPYIFSAGGNTGTIWLDNFMEVKSTSN